MERIALQKNYHTIQSMNNTVQSGRVVSCAVFIYFRKTLHILLQKQTFLMDFFKLFGYQPCLAWCMFSETEHSSLHFLFSGVEFVSRARSRWELALQKIDETLATVRIICFFFKFSLLVYQVFCTLICQCYHCSCSFYSTASFSNHQFSISVN